MYFAVLNLKLHLERLINGTITQLRAHLPPLLSFTLSTRKKSKAKMFVFFNFLVLFASKLALGLPEVSQHYNFISQIPTSSERVRGHKLYRWMEIFHCGYDRKFMKAIKVYRRCNRVPPESRCLLYLPCRSGFV